MLAQNDGVGGLILHIWIRRKWVIKIWEKKDLLGNGLLRESLSFK